MTDFFEVLILLTFRPEMVRSAVARMQPQDAQVMSLLEVADVRF